jgi:Spy/CpxP family protein refolding chaperone
MKRQLTKLMAMGAMAAAMALAQTTATSTTAPPAAGKGLKAQIEKRLIKALDLTDAQKQQAKTILQATKQQAQPLAQQAQQDRQALSAAVQAGDTAKIQAISTELGTVQGQLLAVRSQGRAQLFALLTPDQKAKAVAFLEKVQQVLGNKG